MKRQNSIYLIVGLLIGVVAMYFILRPASSKEQTEISHAALVQNIERIGNLEIVRYNIKDIIEYKKIRQWLPNAKTVLVASGQITIAIDLTQITSDDIQTKGDTINLTLPRPTIHHVKIDHSESKIYNMEFGLWESEKIADDTYRQAELYLKEQAVKLNYEEEAYKNTISLLTPMLQAMGFEHVTISFKSQKQQLKQ